MKLTLVHRFTPEEQAVVSARMGALLAAKDLIAELHGITAPCMIAPDMSGLAVVQSEAAEPADSLVESQNKKNEQETTLT
jgi:hypothetical protein